MLCARRAESNIPLLDETLFWIFNMCRYDWAEPDEDTFTPVHHLFSAPGTVFRYLLIEGRLRYLPQPDDSLHTCSLTVNGGPDDALI